MHYLSFTACISVCLQKHGMGGTPGLKEYKRSRERQQTTGTGVGVSGSFIANTLAPQQLSKVEWDDTVMQVCRGRGKGGREGREGGREG